MHIIDKIFKKIVKKASNKNIRYSKLKNLNSLLIIFGAGSLYAPLVHSEQIANSSIDLKNEVEDIKQKNFKNKDNLDTQIKDSFNKDGKIKNTVNETTIFLKNISFTGNKTISEEKLNSFFENLIDTNVTFSDLSNAVLKAQ
jgi:hemolysin activation/secretion protein